MPQVTIPSWSTRFISQKEDEDSYELLCQDESPGKPVARWAQKPRRFTFTIAPSSQRVRRLCFVLLLVLGVALLIVYTSYHNVEDPVKPRWPWQDFDR